MHFPANDFWENMQPICPYCKAKYGLDGMRYEDEELKELQCDECNKYFICQVRVKAVFDTMGDCEKNGQLPHNLKKGWSEHSPFTCIKCACEFYDWELEGGRYQSLTKDKYTFETGFQPAEKK